MNDLGERQPQSADGGDPDRDRPVDVYLVAGEASGDLHAANLVTAMRSLQPDLRARALGGPRLAEAGCEIAVDLTAFSVMGIKRVIPLLGRFVNAVSLFRDELKALRPKALVLIDYPGLNFILARVARKVGIPVVYYVCPQLWAWAPWRVRKIKRLCDLLLVIFSFEERFFAGGSADVVYVGHPLCDELARLDREALRRDVRARCGAAPDDVLVGLFPGSRRQEVAGLASFMAEAARRLGKRRPELKFAFSCLKEGHASLFPGDAPWSVVKGPGEPLMAAADLAVVASGTASLELAYFGTPMVVVYPLSRWQQRCFQLFRTTPFISTVNLLARRELVPERFLAGVSDVDEVVRLLGRFLTVPGYRVSCRAGLADIASQALGPGASRRAAELILRVSDRNREASRIQ